MVSLTIVGLPRAGTNNFQNSMVYSYLPAFIATFIEPFWVLITRYTALVMPYQELSKGNSSPIKSLTVDYDSKPPHLVAYRAFRARHFLLSALSIMVLASNLLVVGLGGLFELKTVGWEEPTNFMQSLSPIMKPGNVSINGYIRGSQSGPTEAVRLDNPNYTTGDIRQLELFYRAFANSSQNLSLPQWTSSEFFFLPFDSPDPKLQGKPRQGKTRGYGVDIQCKAVSKDQTKLVIVPWLMSGKLKKGVDYRLNITQPCRAEGGDEVGSMEVAMITSTPHYLRIGEGWGDSPLVLTPGPAYINFGGSFHYGRDPNKGKDVKQCPGLFIMGWIQMQVEPWNNSTGWYAQVSEPEYVAIVCESRFQTAIFSIRVDGNNMVLDHERDGNWDDPDTFFFNTTAARFISLFDQTMSDDTNNLADIELANTVTRVARSDPRPYDWVNFLMRNLPGVTGVDKPGNSWPPDPNVAGKALERVYKSMFAIFLQRYSDGLFSPIENASVVLGYVSLFEQRMDVSQPMYIISTIILGLFIIVGIATYIIRPGSFLTHLPSSLAVNLSTFYASNAVDDVAGTEALQPDQRARFLQRLGNKYGYGVFIGRDGKAHFGIDREPLLLTGSKAMVRAKELRAAQGFSE